MAVLPLGAVSKRRSHEAISPGGGDQRGPADSFDRDRDIV